MTDLAAPAVPSTSTPSSSNGGLTLETIMAQLQRMDAHLDTLSDELSLQQNVFSMTKKFVTKSPVFRH